MKKKLPFCFLASFFMLASLPCLSQIPQAFDSVLVKLSSLEEQERADKYINYVRPLMTNDLQSGYDFVNKTKTFAGERGDTILLIMADALTAEYHWRKGDYKKALESAVKSIELAQSKDRFVLQTARGYQTAGTIHLYLYNKEEALDYYRKATKLYLQENKLTSVSSIYNNTGVVFMDAAKEENNPQLNDSAIYYYNKVIDLGDTPNKGTTLNALSNIGSIYIEREEWQKAEYTYQKWLSMEPDELNKTMTYGPIGLMYLNLNDLEKSEQYLSQGLSLARQRGSKFEEHEYLHYLSMLKEKQGLPQVALNYFKEYVSAKDSLYNIEKVNEISELEEKYEAAQREKEITEANASLAKKEQFQIFLLVVITLLVITAAVVYYNYRIKLRANAILDEQNRAKSKLFTIISHDLKNPVSAFRNMTEGLVENLENLPKTKIEEYLKKIQSNAAGVENQLNELLIWSSQQLDKKFVRTQRTPLKPLVDELMQLVAPMAEQQNVALNHQVEKGFALVAHPELLKTVLINLVTNAIKFTASGGKVTLDASLVNQKPIIKIEDTGIGMTAEELNLLLHSDERDLINNHKNKGTGLGFSLSKEILNKLNGEITAASTPGHGTTFTLSF